MTVKNYVKQNLNLPNALTLLRLCLIPVYVVFFVHGQKYPALAVFLIACLTDFLDGQIARRFHLITDFGKLMDPLADKVMVLTVMISMAFGAHSIAPAVSWEIVAFLLLKESVMVAGGLALLRNGVVVYASLIGKVAHGFFIAGLTASFFHLELAALSPGWLLSPDQVLIWIAAALTLWALVFYVVNALRKAREMGIIGSKAKQRGER